MKQKQEIHKLCSSLGLNPTIERSARHIRVVLSYGGQRKTFFASLTPSDGRSMKNFKADISRWMKTVNTAT